MVLMCASEAAAETAVADVARIIDTSLPGKAGQAFVDGLRRRLDAEIKEYAEKIRTSSNVEALLAQKCAEAEAAYNAEMSRVSALLMDALRSVAEKWLRGNKRGVTVNRPRERSARRVARRGRERRAPPPTRQDFHRFYEKIKFQG